MCERTTNTWQKEIFKCPRRSKYIRENISTDESVSCFDFTEENNIIIHNINYNIW